MACLLMPSCPPRTLILHRMITVAKCGSNVFFGVAYINFGRQLNNNMDTLVKLLFVHTALLCVAKNTSNHENVFHHCIAYHKTINIKR